MSESATTIAWCPHCENEIEIHKIWTPGGVNDYGGWVLKCSRCGNPFHYAGKDIKMSRVESGASVLAVYDDEVAGSKARALKQFGLSDEPKKKIAKKAGTRRKKPVAKRSKKKKKSKVTKRKR